MNKKYIGKDYKIKYVDEEFERPRVIDNIKYENDNMNKKKYTNKQFENLSTMDMLNMMIDIQLLKINNNNQNRITKENELAMQNMIELLKLRYDIIHNRE